MSVSLSQVQATVDNTSEILENETSERMRLEEEMDKLREEHEKLKKEHGTVQTEVIEAKVEAPVEGSPRLQLGAELDLSLDGLFPCQLIINGCLAYLTASRIMLYLSLILWYTFMYRFIFDTLSQIAVDQVGIN